MLTLNKPETKNLKPYTAIVCFSRFIVKTLMSSPKKLKKIKTFTNTGYLQT